MTDNIRTSLRNTGGEKTGQDQQTGKNSISES